MNKDQSWHTSSIIYQLYVDKFAGNFSNLTSKLDYLSRLGVNTLWLLPHYPSPMVDGGYDISDYYSIRSDLGSMEDFHAFLQAAHSQGLKVLIDMVLNHTSTDHPWFRQHKYWYLRGDDTSRYREAFIHFPDIKNNSNWIPDPIFGDYYYASFYPSQADLNWDNPELVAEMFKVMDFWLDKGVDGFRLDAISRLIKRDHTNCFGLPETHQSLSRIREHIDQNYPDRVLLAESGGWPDEARPFFSSCQLVFNFPLAMHLLTGIPYQESSKFDWVIDWSGQIPKDSRWGSFLTHHDTIDLFFLTNEGEKNWFKNEVDPKGLFTNPEGTSMAARLAEVCKGDPDKIVWATQQLLSLPNTVPILYYGNEIGMRNQILPQKPYDIREYVRGPFDWSEAELQQKDPSSLLNRVRKLILDRLS